MELCLRMDKMSTKSLWVKIKGRAGTVDVIVGFCYKPPNQECGVDEVLYRQIIATSNLRTLALIGDFNHGDIRWRDNTAGHEQSLRFLECVNDNFVIQVIEEPAREGAMLGFVLTSREQLMGNVVLQDSLGCSGHEMVEFEVVKAVSKQQAHCPGPVESRLWPLQGHTQSSPLG